MAEFSKEIQISIEVGAELFRELIVSASPISAFYLIFVVRTNYHAHHQ